MATHNRRAVVKTVGSVAVIGGLAGCAGGQEENGDGNESDMNDSEGNTTDDGMDGGEMASVRVAHLSPDAPNVDIYVDGEAVLEDVAFRDVSDYLELEPATYDVQITEAGDQEAVIYEDSLEVEAVDYTVAAVGEAEEENEPLAVEVFEDDLSDPGENARIRGIHAAPDAPAVDIVGADSGDALFEGLGFGESATAEAPPGEYTFDVVPAGEDDAEPVASFDASVEAGTIYSAFAVGYLEPDDAPVDEEFGVEIVEDTTGTTGGNGMDNEST
ncbi:DUF4397 domain-containing protein [Halohasta litorea]|uniref:DUF4397 domain-containing protein n=1 Tax=Halohasta litorea TaxID=869891 RepID=A0ABD6D740_9EURY|nr:DUF4397 domain-containing protein [Halohasta litorea]